MKVQGMSAALVAGALAACAGSGDASVEARSSTACDRLEGTSEVVQAFYEPGNVYAARELDEQQPYTRALAKRTVGAELRMHAQPGMNQQYVQRALTCHATARRPAHPNDPLVPAEGRVTSVSVRAVGAGLAIRVRGDGPAAGREIWQRSQAFVAPGGSVRVDQVATREHAPAQH